ncbi:UPF0450 protein C17orf58 homolog [Latimeria chalumnae]
MNDLSSSVSAQKQPKGRPSKRVVSINEQSINKSNHSPPDLEENRPGKINSYKFSDFSGNSSRPSVITNRHSSSLLYHFNILREESTENQEQMCLLECRKEKDEREYYCFSEFAINGIVYDVEIIGKGVRLITLLMNGDGFYKLSRLYITPDGFFLKIKVLVVDTLSCTRSCPDFKPGNRYIMMGQIYHKRERLPQTVLELVAGKMKPGDGLLRSSDYVKRFNRKRDQKMKAAAQRKCK